MGERISGLFMVLLGVYLFLKMVLQQTNSQMVSDLASLAGKGSASGGGSPAATSNPIPTPAGVRQALP